MYSYNGKLIEGRMRSIELSYKPTPNRAWSASRIWPRKFWTLSYFWNEWN